MSGHTPGPWTVDKHYSRIHAGPFEVLLTNGVGATPDVWTANVHLIAAAPELLRFVQAFADVPTETEVPGHWSDTAAMDRMIQVARALVAKADRRESRGTLMTAERLAQLRRFAHYAAYHVPAVELVMGLKDAEAGDDMLELCDAIAEAKGDVAYFVKGWLDRELEQPGTREEIIESLRGLREAVVAKVQGR